MPDRITFDTDQWVEFHTPATLPTRGDIRLRAALSPSAASAATASPAGDGALPAGEPLRSVAAWGQMYEAEAFLIAAVVRDWSLTDPEGRPLPITGDAILDDLPKGVYLELSKAAAAPVADCVAGLNRDFGFVPRELASRGNPTGTSKGSSGRSRAAVTRKASTPLS